MKARAVFARQLNEVPLDQIIMMDECSVELWHKPGRTWCSAENRVVAPLNAKRLSNITIYGAVGMPLTKPVFMTAETTNSKRFSEFLDEIIQNLRIPFDGNKMSLVLDNHPAHKKNECREKMSQWF